MLTIIPFTTFARMRAWRQRWRDVLAIIGWPGLAALHVRPIPDLKRIKQSPS